MKLDYNGKSIAERIFRSATDEGLGDIFGNVSEGCIIEYEKLAKGNIKYIITSHFCIDKDYRANGNQLIMSADVDQTMLKRMVEVTHKHGATIIAQISHAGDKSPFTSFDLNTVSKEELQSIKTKFINAAQIAKVCGFDGVQIHLAHGYLLSTLLDPYANQREDEYGGSNEKRYALVDEIMRGVRTSCGEGFNILVKMNSNNTLREPHIDHLITYGKMLEISGCDGIELSGLGLTSDAKEKPAPYFLLEAKQLAEQVTIPVIVVGGIDRMELVREVLNDGIPFVSLSRPFIRQPNMLCLPEEQRFQCIHCSECFTSHRTMFKRCIFDKEENEQARLFYQEKQI